ncbi:ribose-phosphate pyrophosphokinase-like domain-containing protein [Sinorhizobium sp. 7-81]|nr:ribose-phosphate pyrophosphokinase-like domain-containing protein [Sinorhizobium sp. 8-89]
MQQLNVSARESVNDKLCELLFFIACCREGGASRVTALVPNLPYVRTDRQTKTREPVTIPYLTALVP